MPVSDSLRTLISVCGFTQRELADVLEKDESVVSDWKREVMKPHWYMAETLEKAAGWAAMFKPTTSPEAKKQFISGYIRGRRDQGKAA